MLGFGSGGLNQAEYAVGRQGILKSRTYARLHWNDLLIAPACT